MPRTYPALDVIWPLQPDDERLEIVLAEIDDEAPTAVEPWTDRLRIFFPSPVARGRAAVRIVALEPDLVCQPVDVPDDDWAERSQASLGAVQVGRIIVAPPWVRPRETGTVITIQPSMGFGTAHHASTRLCLAMLQELSVNVASVLDVGTGSGVLAIAAARLGAARVLAIDNDADALVSARENVTLNQVDGLVTLEQKNVGDMADASFDVVLANLTGATLTRHADVLTSLVAVGGSLIASGIETHEQDAVRDSLVAAGLQRVAQTEEAGWAAIRLTRTSPTPSTTR
jgi:ribosomal protein L11 methyltransferase